MAKCYIRRRREENRRETIRWKMRRVAFPGTVKSLGFMRLGAALVTGWGIGLSKLDRS